MTNIDQLLQDDDLLIQMAAGDKGAFSVLYHRYWETLFVTAGNVLRSKDDAADVVQEVFLNIWNKRHELVITGSFLAYLKASTRNRAINFIEKNITRRDYLAMLTETEVESLSTSPEAQLQLKELQTVIHTTVQQLPPKMQEVYLMSRHQHLSHQEIADHLGISAKTVKKHIQLALQAIRKALDTLPGSLTHLLVIIFLKNY